jgi:RIO kinase 1
MRIPDSLETLLDQGILQDVIRPLRSGKEAQIYLVVAEGAQCVAKVYKEADQRSFTHRGDYTEGRKTRNSRDQRAMGKRSRHGRAQTESNWRTTEVDTIYRLRDAGVRVPHPYHFIDGVLVMELITDGDGYPAKRLGELDFTADEAKDIFRKLMQEVVRMVCVGTVHGDLSDFNILMAADGPVIIDFPQAIDAANNQNARKILLRDVENLQNFVSRFVPGYVRLPFAEEIWQKYEGGELTPTYVPKGSYKANSQRADTQGVKDLIADADGDERMRRTLRGESLRGMQAPSPQASQPSTPTNPRRPSRFKRR